MTHQFGLPNNLYTMLDAVTTVVDVLECNSNDIHVIICIYTTCDAQTKKVQSSETVLTGYRITVSKDVTDLAATDTSLDVKFDGKSLCRELLLRYLIQNLVRVNKDCMTADRTLIWDSVLIKFRSKILYLTDTSLDGLEFSVLIKTNSKSSHITTVHTTVSKEAFEWDTEPLCTLISVLMSGCNESTHIDKTVFL